MVHLARLPAFVAEKATKQGSWSDTIIMELKNSAETRRNVMKKILAAATAALVLSACSSGVTQEQYDQAVAEVSQYSAELEEEKSANEALNKELSEAKGNYEELSKEYSSYEESMNAYKESMAEYEGLAEAEVEKRRIEAESIAESESIAKEESKAAEEASKEASRAAEEASKEAAERMGYETGITFDQLARNPDDYEGQKVKFTGKVLQVIEGSGTKNQIRMSTKGNWDNVIYCEYEKSIVSSRILEDDKITIYGRSAGLLSYESTGSGVITLPSIIIDKIEQK